MTPEIFTLCEAATAKNGQWCILHTLNNYRVQAFPAVVAVVIVSQVRCRLNEEGDHKMELILMGPDGSGLWASDPNKFYIKMPAGVETFAYANMTVMQLEVHQPGQHDLRMEVDDRELISIPLGIFLA